MAHIPPPPDFASIEAAAPKTAEQRSRVLALIGNIVFSWSNNESLFIYVLSILLATDEVSAAIVFTTLNTTRARLDLIQRLAKVKIRDPDVAAELDKLIARFNKASRVRNEFNHCLYTVGETGEITHTQTMKLQEVRGHLRWGEMKPMDEMRLKQISKAIADLTKLNRDIWSFLPRLQAACGAKAPARRNGTAGKTDE
ncbi:hypothetical protein H2509_02410 [Stappia sp. F7233]|uniref:Uncharacterized protein n=2 Tax=Stappia albiluteola TaxID=2758565 RepID=A0A839A9X1_9HYPH|nr:hypothetical protein [Stappia albiluteola]